MLMVAEPFAITGEGGEPAELSFTLDLLLLLVLTAFIEVI